MEIIFLLGLLAVVVYLNRGIFGFSSGCDWMRSDQEQTDGSVKWLCNTCGQVELTADTNPPPNCKKS